MKKKNNLIKEEEKNLYIEDIKSMLDILLDQYEKTVNKWEPAVRLVLACEGLTCPVGRFSVRNLSECQKKPRKLVRYFPKKIRHLKIHWVKNKNGIFYDKTGYKIACFFNFWFCHKTNDTEKDYFFFIYQYITKNVFSFVKGS